MYYLHCETASDKELAEKTLREYDGEFHSFFETGLLFELDLSFSSVHFALRDAHPHLHFVLVRAKAAQTFVLFGAKPSEV